jgi:hypothetical protein
MRLQTTLLFAPKHQHPAQLLAGDQLNTELARTGGAGVACDTAVAGSAVIRLRESTTLAELRHAVAEAAVEKRLSLPIGFEVR